MQFRDVIDDDDYYDVIEEDNNCDVIDTGMITQQSCHVEYLLPQLIWFKVNIRLLEATYHCIKVNFIFDFQVVTIANYHICIQCIHHAANILPFLLFGDTLQLLIVDAQS